MRCINLVSIALFSGVATSTLTGYVDKCFDDSTCCTNPARFLRRTGTCTPDKICCETKRQPKFYQSADLRCAKSNIKSSKVEVTVAPCKDDPAQDCLHVEYRPFSDGTPYTEYHLQLSSLTITNSALGKSKFSDTCAFSAGNLAVDCYIRLTRIATEVYGNSTLNFCTKPTLYIAAHAVEGPETCWAGNTLIGGTGNWAKYFSGSFLDCETICKKECACLCPPPPPKETKYCEKGTGFCEQVGRK